MDGLNNSTTPVVAVVVTDKLNDKVIALIVTLTGQNTVFTAFDITKQLRREHPGLSVPHPDVKGFVVANYLTDDNFAEVYEKECIELKTGDRAIVYYPNDATPYDHPMAVQPASVPAAVNAASPAAAPDTDLTIHNRLNIPISLLDKLGLVPGKLVRIETDNGVMSLTEVTASTVETLNINADGRLRLNARTLTNAFGRLPDKFDISISSCRSKIEITPK